MASTSFDAPSGLTAAGGAPASPPVEPARRTRRRGRALSYLLLTPAGIAVFATLLYPVGTMILLSFQRENLGDLITRTTTWVGLANYREVLTDPGFWTVLPRTLGFAATCVALTLLIATGCALLLQRAARWARTVLSVAMVVAWATPVIIGAVVFTWLFDTEFGVVNYLLTRSGLCDCQGHSWFG